MEPKEERLQRVYPPREEIPLSDEKVAICRLLEETNKDTSVEAITWYKERSLVAVDFAKSEVAVLMLYHMDGQSLVIDSIHYQDKEVPVDIHISEDIVLSNERYNDILKEYGPYKMNAYDGMFMQPCVESNSHDKHGNYRFDYGRNDHPRSPRKRR